MIIYSGAHIIPRRFQAKNWNFKIRLSYRRRRRIYFSHKNQTYRWI